MTIVAKRLRPAKQYGVTHCRQESRHENAGLRKCEPVRLNPAGLPTRLVDGMHQTMSARVHEKLVILPSRAELLLARHRVPGGAIIWAMSSAQMTSSTLDPCSDAPAVQHDLCEREGLR